MAYITRYIYLQLRNLYEEHKDPRVANLPLLGSPMPMVISIAVYLAFVLYFGPNWMRNRKPYNLKYIMRVYNAIQVIANFLLLVYGLPNCYLRKEFSFLCQPIDHTNVEPWMLKLIRFSYGYYITKYLDLLDTVFFILRKKNNQITFLHVYHHAGMVFAVYVFMTFLAGSHSTMLGVINLLVHTVMYSYYFVTSLRPVKQALWWKKHITQLQLLQFGYLMLHFLIVLLHNPCLHPPLIAFVGLTQNLFMFTLFFDFYYKAYVKMGKPHTNAIAEEKQNVQNHQNGPQTQKQHPQQKQQPHPRQQNNVYSNCSSSNGNMGTAAATVSGKCKLIQDCVPQSTVKCK